ncbi:MAG: cobalamin-independent methionine synthase II family protein [Verrucomicrobiota bacterium]|jgi:5-methyltetrahydropteroyltriglutamate--homocysteine methyltransferase|nr:cobalamin-independent methionine synthase II family protein [Verrucomicrobiota bacterium]MDP7048677.1 cobalamin-independent methionine synthase II family protein [Verrucomicrobiota bacterium]
MANPEIRTKVVGSYPVPAWLAANPSEPALRDAILVVLKTQELAGIDLVSDGELSRFNVSHPETNGMIDYFIQPMGGISKALTREDLARFAAEQRMNFRAQPAGVVEGPLTDGTLNLPCDWQRFRGLSSADTMFTFTAPYMLARTLVDRHHDDIRELTMALAEVLRKQVEFIDAPVIQMDEAHLTGHAEDADWAHEPFNHALGGIRSEKALHLCFGNYGGQSIQKGYWQDLMPFLNRLDVDHLVLEFARRGYDELEAFNKLKPEIKLGIGVVDIKDNEVESTDVIASRIENAVATLGLERIKWVHPDCGFWMLPRSVADRKMAALVAARDQFLGR